MEKSDIDKRVIKWVEYLIANKVFKSEAQYLRHLKLGVSKLSDAKKGKAGFKASDIGVILMNNPQLNANWLMAGRGEMLLSESTTIPNNESLTSHIKEENKELKEKNEFLNREIGRLEGQIIELKKRVQEEGPVICAAASGSDLQE
ncbi:MAG: hypothetical protein RR744_09955 [Cellulosilyticaceae bacterium]